METKPSMLPPQRGGVSALEEEISLPTYLPADAWRLSASGKGVAGVESARLQPHAMGPDFSLVGQRGHPRAHSCAGRTGLLEWRVDQGPGVLFLQAQAWLGLARRKKARALLERVRRRDPSHAQAADLLKELR